MVEEEKRQKLFYLFSPHKKLSEKAGWEIIIKESLLEAARSGDEEAIDALTIRELTLNSQISRRIDTEDIYTIVDSCFIPQGIECDTYSIVGQIRNINKVENVFTNENIWIFGIESNRIIFSLAINEKDLTGEPAVGRRFKGTIWMMGTATWRDWYDNISRTDVAAKDIFIYNKIIK